MGSDVVLVCSYVHRLMYIQTVLEEYAARGTKVCYRLEVPPGFKAK